MAYFHLPVMLEEAMQALDPQPGGLFADGTLGGGGHSEEILKRIGLEGRLYGIDRDRDAIEAASQRLASYPGFTLLHGNFHDIKSLLGEDIKLDGGLLDLGVSSHQLDSEERGFSYHDDAPLDMRMDRSQGMTAAAWLNSVDAQTFTRALYDYADEKWAARIANVLLERRAIKPLRTTHDLVDIVDRAIPKKVRLRDEGHPARRTFQAVRIAVNDEIGPLRQALFDWLDCLKPGGRLCVITFHSIEDRVVKLAFREMQTPCICPPKLPLCTCGRKRMAVALPGGAIKPSAGEVARNPRARSAILRAVRKEGG